MDQPQVRANWLKLVIHSAKRAPESLGGPILARIPDEMRREIRVAGRLAWLPATKFVHLTDAIVEAAGHEGARGFWRQMMRLAIDVPFMRPLLNGALFLWGDTPAGLVRRTPQAWHLVAKNCGDFKAIEVDEPNAIIFRCDNVAPLFRAPSLVPMWEGGLESEVDWVGVKGSVETHADKLAARGVVEFIVRWTPKISTVR
jgi:hypothetical protein